MTQKIELNSKKDFLQIAKRLENFQLGESPRKEVFESFCLYTYIISLYKLKKLSFPFFVNIGQSPEPDFVINLNNHRYGLEQTNATTNSKKHAESIFQNYPEGSLMELPAYSSDETSKENVKKGLKKPEEPLMSVGWGDNGQENCWVECVLKSIIKKTKKLNNQYIQCYPINELIIYDDTPTIAPRLGQAIPQLRKIYDKFVSEKGFKNKIFNMIHVVSDNSFIFDIFKEKNVIDIGLASLKKLV